MTSAPDAFRKELVDNAPPTWTEVGIRISKSGFHGTTRCDGGTQQMDLTFAEDLPVPHGLPAADVVIYPIAMEGDIGVYSESTLTLAKQLRAMGIEAEYQHDSDHRTWLGLNGSEMVANLCISLGSSGAVAIIQSLLMQKPSRRIHIRAARRKDTDGSTFEWFEATGTGSEIATALDAWKEQPDESESNS